MHPDIGLSMHPDSRVVDLHRERMDLGIRYGNGDWPGVETELSRLGPAGDRGGTLADRRQGDA